MRSLFLSLVMAAAVSGLATQASYAAMSDETMAQLIANDLKESGRLKDYRVGVKYKDGVAWLMGTVTSRQQKQVAELIVGNCEGVVHVVSKLEIESPPNQRPQQGLRVVSASVSSRALKTSGRSAGRSQIQNNMPVPYARMGQAVQAASYGQPAQYCLDCNQMPGGTMGPAAVGHVPAAMGQAVSYDNPQVPGYAWPSYAAAPNYAALTYPKQYSASAWPYIGPFYPYPQVPLGWRKVTLEWDDGWWFLDFKDSK
ncbi:MAG: BON domain-containing protein [Planctomycetes bacterium]|nr:BON domain-containing protein [Planctomycetota bacterium]